MSFGSCNVKLTRDGCANILKGAYHNGFSLDSRFLNRLSLKVDGTLESSPSATHWANLNYKVYLKNIYIKKNEPVCDSVNQCEPVDLWFFKKKYMWPVSEK